MVQNTNLSLDYSDKEWVCCVLNISEGRDKVRLQELSKILEAPPFSYVLDIHTGRSVNRSVFTILGQPESLFRKLFQLARFCLTHLDIKLHEGIHPRIGIIDVIPFVPILNISLEELQKRVSVFAESFATEFMLPVYLYGAMSNGQQTESLYSIRKAFQKNKTIHDRNLLIQPDFGPKTSHKILGASCITTRSFMAAFNVNLDTEDLSIARAISNKLRLKRNLCTELRNTKFIAWHIPEYGCCQISTNIYELQKLGILKVWKAINQTATEFQVCLKGSEIVGMIPLHSLFQDRSTSGITSTMKLIGLNERCPFVPEKRILELKLKYSSSFL